MEQDCTSRYVNGPRSFCNIPTRVPWCLSSLAVHRRLGVVPSSPRRGHSACKSWFSRSAWKKKNVIHLYLINKQNCKKEPSLFFLLVGCSLAQGHWPPRFSVTRLDIYHTRDWRSTKPSYCSRTYTVDMPQRGIEPLNLCISSYLNWYYTFILGFFMFFSKILIILVFRTYRRAPKIWLALVRNPSPGGSGAATPAAGLAPRWRWWPR